MIIQWNARGLYRSRLEEFRNNLCSINPHIILLSETHWKSQYNVLFSAFNVIKYNRPTQGGGVAILIKKNIPFSQINLPLFENLEAVGACIKLKNNTSLNLLSIYCPNGNECTYEELEELNLAAGQNAIIGGDFNAHAALWDDYFPPNRCGRLLTKLLEAEEHLA